MNIYFHRRRPERINLRQLFAYSKSELFLAGIAIGLMIPMWVKILFS